MKLELIRSDFESYFKDIFDFCKEAVDISSQESKIGRNVEQTIKNMAYKDWESNNHCLLYRLYVKDDFNNGNGMFCVLYEDDKIVSVSGVSKYNDEVSMLARRQYSLLSLKSKGLLHDYFLEPQIAWAKDSGSKAAVILINDYNKWLYNSLKRVGEGKASLLGHEGGLARYRDFIFLGGPFRINYADQYVAMYKIDKDFDEGSIIWDR